MVWVRERTISTKLPPLVGEVIANFFADGGCHVLFYQVAPQLYSRGWVDGHRSKPTTFFSGCARNRTRASGSVANNSDHETTEAVPILKTLVITVIIVLQSFVGPWQLFQFINLYKVGGLLRRGISPTKCRYLHTEHNKHRMNTHTHRHACLHWHSNTDPNVSGRRQFLPHTAVTVSGTMAKWLRLILCTLKHLPVISLVTAGK
jgi:hypothetical protein